MIRIVIVHVSSRSQAKTERQLKIFLRELTVQMTRKRGSYPQMMARRRRESPVKSPFVLLSCNDQIYNIMSGSQNYKFQIHDWNSQGHKAKGRKKSHITAIMIRSSLFHPIKGPGHVVFTLPSIYEMVSLRVKTHILSRPLSYLVARIH